MRSKDPVRSWRSDRLSSGAAEGRGRAPFVARGDRCRLLELARLEIRKFETRDEQEVAGHAEIMGTEFPAWANISINKNHLKQLHRDLLRYSAKDERHRGGDKTLRNDVGAFDADVKMIGILFETATPFDTPRRMTDRVAWREQARDLRRLPPRLIVAVFTPSRAATVVCAVS